MTRGELVRYARETLLEAGIESAAFEAAELVSNALEVSKTVLIADGSRDITEAEKEKLTALLQKRVGGYPLQYLLGEWEFYGRTFDVGEGVLIPRADTETVCAELIRHIGDQPATVLDLCSGSGCIAITIALECPNCRVYAVEKSKEAFGYLEKNISRNHAPVKAFCGDALEPDCLREIPQCDVIVSNPPYLTASDMAALQKEVAFEPKTALDGGADGLSFYRQLTALWKNRLKPGGRLFYELGAGQERAVAELLIQNGMKSICETPDLCGIIRVISAENIK